MHSAGRKDDVVEADAILVSQVLDDFRVPHLGADRSLRRPRSPANGGDENAGDHQRDTADYEGNRGQQSWIPLPRTRTRPQSSTAGSAYQTPEKQGVGPPTFLLLLL